MAVPQATKIKKGGVEILNNVDRVNYCIRELVRAASVSYTHLCRLFDVEKSGEGL